MKSKTIPFAFLFVAILIAGAFFLSKSVFFSEDKDVFRAKIVTPVSSEHDEVDTDKYNTVMDAEKYETFVPLMSTETLISSITLDFNNDTYDDEIILVKKSGSLDLWLIPGIYSVETGEYERLTEIYTGISKSRTFSYSGMDITGDHRNALIFQGDTNENVHIMKIFLMNKDSELEVIGDFSSDGIIFVQQTERSESYDLSLSKGESFSVWVYKSESMGEGEEKNGALSNQIQQEYKWNVLNNRYELAREIKVTSKRLAAKELSRIQDGKVETFASFLNGLWYKTSNSDSNIRYLYFDYPKKEIILVKDGVQEIYLWEDSNLRHNGIYLATVNSSIMNLKRRFDISLVGVDEIKITLRDDIKLLIKESNLWDGNYKKFQSQSTISEDSNDSILQLEKELLSCQTWSTTDEQNIFLFSDDQYKIVFNDVEETGIYSFMKIADYDVIQFRSNNQTSMLNETYVMKFGVKIITEKQKKKTVEKTVTNYDEITLTPVKITPNDCFSIEGRSYTIGKK